MRGTLVSRTWEHDPSLDAPPRYRKACTYEAFIPDPLAGIAVDLPGDVAGTVSEAEKAIARLNSEAGPTLAPLARLLLRTESIASSKVEGLQVGTRGLARAEAQDATGRRIGADAAEILANIDAMQFAIEEATVGPFTAGSLGDIHRVLMARAPNAAIAGRVRERQNWIGGNDTTRAGRTSYHHRPRNSRRCSPTSPDSQARMTSHRWCRRRSHTPSSKRSTPSRTATVGRGER